MIRPRIKMQRLRRSQESEKSGVIICKVSQLFWL
ncbi:hypothetical protein HU200_026997 [Digitaria exilis]|uniref:Uncharacterized protein n=1 Tax=Digitaria exilis TaxID=1010633 RepID=A0A835BX18_9POAL|nr:hypothetical protein HU200_026997 [Digitaria exilis]